MMRGFDIQGGLTVGWRRSRSGCFRGLGGVLVFRGGAEDSCGEF